MRFIPDVKDILNRIEDLIPARVHSLWRWFVYSGAALPRALWLIDISILITLIFGIYILYVQIFTPMRIPYIYVAAYIPGILGLLIMRGRMEVATSMLRTKKMSTRTWKMLSRTGGVITFLSVALMDYMCGYNCTHLAYMISSLITYMTAYACILFLIMPTAKTSDEALRRANRSPFLRLMPTPIKAWGRLIWEYI